MKELKAHFGKKITTVKIRVALPEKERKILKDALLKIIDNLKLDDIDISETNPYKEKHQPKPKEEPKEEEPEVIDPEVGKRAFKEIEELMKSFGIDNN